MGPWGSPPRVGRERRAADTAAATARSSERGGERGGARTLPAPRGGSQATSEGARCAAAVAPSDDNDDFAVAGAAAYPHGGACGGGDGGDSADADFTNGAPHSDSEAAVSSPSRLSLEAARQRRSPKGESPEGHTLYVYSMLSYHLEHSSTAESTEGMSMFIIYVILSLRALFHGVY